MLLQVLLQCYHILVDTIMANGARMNCNDMDIEFRLGQTNLVANVTLKAAGLICSCVGAYTRFRGKWRLWAWLWSNGVN
jgi:hypothetical protein